MNKIEKAFILDQYRSGVNSYADFTREVGLWASEQHVFEEYINPADRILDLGCGTGRTTFPLYQLGYHRIVGVDLTPEMVQQARQLNVHFGTNIDFRVGSALDLDFPDAHFDTVLFSFNGVMSIPSQANRDLALQEIGRVLKAGGTFIFTTHDRERGFETYWAEETERWQNGAQDARLYQFGDRIAHSKNETREIFIHIPTQAEVKDWLHRHHFTVLETFYRSDRFDEMEAVKEKSGECRFWVARN